MAPPPPPVEINGELEFEVEAILDSRRSGNKGIKYLVSWKGYEERTWENPANVANASELVEGFHARYPRRPRPDGALGDRS
jgi:hypothetical protein